MSVFLNLARIMPAFVHCPGVSHAHVHLVAGVYMHPLAQVAISMSVVAMLFSTKKRYEGVFFGRLALL